MPTSVRISQNGKRVVHLAGRASDSNLRAALVAAQEQLAAVDVADKAGLFFEHRLVRFFVRAFVDGITAGPAAAFDRRAGRK